MVLVNIDDINILFIHIPKCGGTSIERFLDIKSRWPTRSFEELYGPHYIQRNNPNLNRSGKARYFIYLHLQHLTIQQMYRFKLYDPKKADYIFTVVRNPYTRMISDYYWNDNNKNHSTFYKFLLFYKNNPDRIHSKKQVDFIHNNVNLNIKIFRFEDIEDVFDSLRSKCNSLKTKESLCLNSTKIKNKLTINTISKKAIKLVNELYKEDFDEFGYEMIDPDK